jgi:hypothetical protein
LTDELSVCRQTDNGVAMSDYSHLSSAERDQIAEIRLPR